MHVVIVTGLSGSGKSTAIRALEDLGFYCIDNLPVALIPHVLTLSENAREPIGRVALGIDGRGGDFLDAYPTVLAGLRTSGHAVKVLYFEAPENVLLRRFSETRRPHPAAGEHSVLHGIRTEERGLAGLRESADQVIDTSSYTVHELRNVLARHAETDPSMQRTLRVTVQSFGYKYGVPIDADLMLDVRFLPNPFFVEALRDKSGTDRQIVEFVLGQPEAAPFLDRLSALLEPLMPLYVREGKSYLMLAVGCTGGRHRSVAVAEEVGRRLRAWDYTVRVHHRDVQRADPPV